MVTDKQTFRRLLDKATLSTSFINTRTAYVLVTLGR
jgi:hypothetical protein